MENKYSKICIAVLVVICVGISIVRSDDAADKEACKAMAKQYFKRTHKIYIDCHADVKANTTNGESLEEAFEKFGVS